MDIQPIDDCEDCVDFNREHTLLEDLYTISMELRGLGRAFAHELKLYKVVEKLNNLLLKLWKPKRTRR